MHDRFHCLASISPGKYDWNIKVRVVNLWEVRDLRGDSRVSSIHMIFVDEHGQKMHATVVKNLVSLFKGRMLEGEVYRMSYFSVVPNNISSGKFYHPFGLLFHFKTKVALEESSLIPRYGLTFINSHEIPKGVSRLPYLADVCGLVVSLSVVNSCAFDGTLSKIVCFDLASDSDRFKCIMRGEYSDQFQSLIEKASEGLPIVLLQTVRLCNSDGTVIVESFDAATRIMFNPSIAEFFQLKFRLANLLNSPGNCIDSPGLKSKTSVDGDFLRSYPKKNLNELNSLLEDGCCFVVGRVVDVFDEDVWWFPVCCCGLDMFIHHGSYFCSQCCNSDFFVVPRLTSRFSVEDGTANAVFHISERVVPGMFGDLSVLRASLAQKEGRGDHPVSVSGFKGRDIMFKVERTSKGASMYPKTYNVEWLCLYESFADDFVFHGRCYTPAKCCFRPSFSSSPGHTVLSNTEDRYPLKSYHADAIVEDFPVLPNNCLFVSKKNLSKMFDAVHGDEGCGSLKD